MPGKLKTRFRNQAAMTLTELLIASALVGVIMLGTVSVDYAIRSTKRNASNMSALAMRAAAVMFSITRDTIQTVGDVNNPPIYTFNNGTEREICFRQDTDRNPSSYSGDSWVCYHHGSDYLLRRCERGPTNPMVFTDCSSTSPSSIGVQLLPSFYSVSPFFAINSGVDGIIYIEFDIAAISDSSSPVDNLSNPMHHLNFRVSPPGLSRK